MSPCPRRHDGQQLAIMKPKFGAIVCFPPHGIQDEHGERTVEEHIERDNDGISDKGGGVWREEKRRSGQKDPIKGQGMCGRTWSGDNKYST